MISPMGVFELNPTLIPAVNQLLRWRVLTALRISLLTGFCYVQCIGITMTYLLIMIQVPEFRQSKD